MLTIQDISAYDMDIICTKCCKKLVVDMHYEAGIQAVINYHGTILGTKVSKADARTMTLEPEQYLQVNTEH